MATHHGRSTWAQKLSPVKLSSSHVRIYGQERARLFTTKDGEKLQINQCERLSDNF